MLSVLSALASDLALSFRNGSASQLNQLTDGLTEFPALLLVGYGKKGQLSIDGYGKVKRSYRLILMLITPSEVESPVPDVNRNLDTLEPIAHRIVSRLSSQQQGATLTADFDEFTNDPSFDRPMDGFAIQVTVTPSDQPRLC